MTHHRRWNWVTLVLALAVAPVPAVGQVTTAPVDTVFVERADSSEAGPVMRVDTTYPAQAQGELIMPVSMQVRSLGIPIVFSLIFVLLARALESLFLRVEARLASLHVFGLSRRKQRLMTLLARAGYWLVVAYIVLRAIFRVSAQVMIMLQGVLILILAIGAGGFLFGFARTAGERWWRSVDRDPLPESGASDAEGRSIVAPTGPSESETPPPPANKYAVFIGIDAYDDDRIRPLNCASADARAMRDLFIDPAVCGVPEENTVLLLNEEATERAIRSAMGKWLPERAGPNDVAYVYFAGHGAPAVDPAGLKQDGLEKYLVPFDAVMDDLRSSAIAMDTFRQFFEFIATRQLVFFMDACYSGGVGGRTFSDPRFQGRSAILDDVFLEEMGGEGRLILSACDVNEVSLELPEDGHGIFTRSLLDGIAGAADANGDGTVSLDELYDYVFTDVSARARALGARMSPVRKGSMRGTIHITNRAG